MLFRAPIVPAMAALPIATLLAGLTVGSAQVDPTARAEVTFLAFLAALGAAAIVGLERRGGTLAATFAGGSVLVLWVTRPGPLRNVAIVTLMIAGLALAARVAWRRNESMSGGSFDPVSVGALALAIQALARPRLLLAVPEPEALAMLVGLPIAVAITWHFFVKHSLAQHSLAKHSLVDTLSGAHGQVRALSILGVVALATPGWTVPSVAVVVGITAAIVCGPLLAVVFCLAAGGLAFAFGGTVAALLVVLAALAASRDRRLTWASAALALVAAIGIVATNAEVDRWLGLGTSVVGATVLAFATVPLLFAGLGTGLRTGFTAAAGRRAGPVFAGWSLLVLALATPALATPALATPGLATPGLAGASLAAGLAVLATSMTTTVASVHRLQSWWLGVVGIMTLTRASLPRADREPFEDSLALLGLVPDGRGLLLAFGLALALTAMAYGLGRIEYPPEANDGVKLGTPKWAGVIVTVIAAGLIFLAQTSSTAWPSSSVASSGFTSSRTMTGIFAPTVVLTADRGLWRQRLEPGARVGHVIIDSSAIASVGLAPDEVVAKVVLLDADGEITAEWPVRLGRDTAEWAAERPDVAARLSRVPEHGFAFVAPDGDFLARRFRARFSVDGQPAEARQIVIRRRNGLPPNVGLRVDRVEVVP